MICIRLIVSGFQMKVIYKIQFLNTRYSCNLKPLFCFLTYLGLKTQRMFTFLSKSSARKEPQSVSNCLHFKTENSFILGGLLCTEVSESSLSCNLISGVFPFIIPVCVVVCVFRGRWMRLLYMFLRSRKDWQFLMRKAKKMGMIKLCVYLWGRETDKIVKNCNCATVNFSVAPSISNY